MRHYTLYNICKTMLLAQFLLWAVVGEVFAQWPEANDYTKITIKNRTPEPSDLGGHHEIIYANNGESKTFQLQKPSEGGNLDGYIRWYEIEQLADLTNTDAQTINKDHFSLTQTNDGNAHQFKNGYAWIRKGGNHSKTLSEIKYTVDFSSSDVIYLVCEASSNNNLEESSWTAPMVSYRQVYEIRKASSRQMKESVGNAWDSNLPAVDANLKAKFLQSYEIHMPINRRNASGKNVANQTTFRLPERLSNYYVPRTNSRDLVEATQVRWRIYNADEQRSISKTETSSDNMLKDYTLYSGPTYTAKRTYYITSEVRATGGSGWGEWETDWYPVSLITVILEPYAEALTEGELADKIKGNDKRFYQQRSEEYLLNHQYVQLEDITFETDDEVLKEANNEAYLKRNPSKNYSTVPMRNVDSYYAFANPGDYSYRRNQRMSVGRGEYALYRTLNYPDISKGTISSLGVYRDFFANEGRYNKIAVDRLWEKTGGKESGYFMYVDATDDPGVITKMNISGLCPHTSLVVSAWICDMAESTSTSQADVGFTFKRVVNNEEVILSRFYSGNIDNKPAHDDNSENTAKWQQVFFQFSFPDGAYEDKYILEIANNAPSSSGADYAIDDIKVYKSSPAITAQRESACSASVLVVSSDYQTLQNNMGWNIDPNVLDKIDINDPKYRKYRYGMMGDDPYESVENVLHSNVGNVYFAFTEIEGQAPNEKPGNWVVLNKEIKEYPVLNNLGLEYAMRVAVQTDMNTASNDNLMIRDNPSDAKKSEIIMNVRAMNDFLEDVKRGKWKEDDNNIVTELTQLIGELCEREASTGPDAQGASNPLKIKNGSVKVDKIIANESIPGGNGKRYGDEYEKAVRDLYACLEIPRIRCPWRSSDNTMLYLSEIDVYNTDLRFMGEKYTEDGQEKEASGEYYVILFSAKNIAYAGEDNADDMLDLDSECALKKKMYVMPSTTIAVDTQTDDNVIACVGSIQSVNAHLMVAEVDEVGNVTNPDMKPFEEAYKGHSYTFDWYLGTEEQFDAICAELNIRFSIEDLQGIIAKLRNELNKRTAKFDVEDVKSSMELSEDEKKLLIRLLGGGGNDILLASGNGKIQFRFVDKVYAMPYIPDIKEIGKDPEGNEIDLTKSFCAEGKWFPLAEGTNSPGLNVGFPGVDYQEVQLTNVPLRLGLCNLKDETIELTIPIQNQIKYGIEGAGHVLRNLQSENKKKVLLQVSGETYVEVGDLISLFAKNREGDQVVDQKNSLTLRFNMTDEDINEHFKEGKIYSLYIPFGEYESESAASPIAGSCEGTAYLQIKIVPEYLTWSGNSTDKWYDDAKWEQSTKAELYKGSDGTDANGTDNIKNAFAPLYFTKITIDPEKGNGANQLTLEDLSIKDNVLQVKDGGTANIQYDMAMDVNENGQLIISPYYINKVKEIYFKPEATLVHQELLSYDKAWVEFEMRNSESYWKASPLQNVFAGDMYAPTATGRQATEAFKPIEYDHETGTNSRWKPAFYQKAWDSAISYANNAKDGVPSEDDIVKNGAVKNNWSIEYNDVTVPYKIGKGFYARVEDTPGSGIALVRLPKADVDYKYEVAATKALDQISKEDAVQGKLVQLDENGTYSIDVSDVDNNNDHFLVGNPFMSYLNMEKFFEENPDLNEVYWTLQDNVVNVTIGEKGIVGTPDVKWTSNATETGENNIQGLIKPMSAFFVERKGYTEQTKAGEESTATVSKIIFSTKMMADAPTASATTKSSGISASNPALTLTAERGDIKSRALLTTRDNADNGYRADEDAVVLLDSELDAPMVYTVSGSRAAQVNAVREIKNIGLGVYGKGDDEVTLTIEGLSRLANPLYLYDAQTRESVRLEGDSYSLTIPGESHGRYFLRDAAPAAELENTISIYSVRRGEVIVSALRPVRDIQVYTVGGSLVRRLSVNATSHTFHLPAGLYIIHATDGDTEATEKVLVR